MTALLDRAFTPESPGGPLPPGPRSNDWTRMGATPVPEPSSEADLLDELWAPRGWHLREDGSRMSVPRRLVPSAGGAYPVQWHVVVPSGPPSSLPPGRYARDASGALVLRPGGAPPAGGCVSLVISVQPGRSFGRYRHRAWPLWIADAAYALEAVRVLVPSARLPRAWSALEEARALLAVPRASEPDWWLGNGLVPELCLARVELPPGWELDSVALSRLGCRRSPAPAEFVRAAEGSSRPARAAAREVAAQSGQHWVLGADRVHVWDRPEPVTGGAAYAGLWQAHRQAARLCYRLAGRGLGSRPVSGFTSRPRAGGRRLLHALAVLDPQERPA